MLNLAEWSNENIVLSARNAAEPGPYRIERTPFWIKVAEYLSPASPVQKVIVMKSAQVGFSQLMFNWIGFCAATTPAPILMVQPTTELAERVSKQRIASMIKETKALSEIVSDEKSRNSGNTILLKEFRSGAILLITGANSPVGLRSMPIRFVALDEASAYPADVGGEGSAIALAEKRTSTFKRKKILIGSTPTIAEADVTEQEFLRSDQQRYFVACPFCGGMQWLKFRQLKWVDNDPKTTRYECEHCQEHIEERHKLAMMQPENGADWQPTAESSDPLTVGVHISALYSPWMTWVEVVKEFLEAKGDAPRLKTWTNVVLGETWSEEYQAKVGANELMQRAEDYDGAPAGVLIATAGVDVQPDRLEYSVYGFGDGEEAWHISHDVIMGDPTRPEIWNQLEAALLRPIPHETAGEIKIRAAAIDTGGHNTHDVYNFVRSRGRQRNWFGVKGQSQKNKPAIGRPSKVDVNYRGQLMKSGAEVYPVGSDTIKDVIYGRLKHNEPGPGYFHFPTTAKIDYFEQLTSEKKVTRYVKGFPVREWTKKAGQRNEALDCAVYAYAVLQFIVNQYDKKTVWEQFKKRLNSVHKPLIEGNSDNSGQNKPKQNRINRPGKGFVNSW